MRIPSVRQAGRGRKALTPVFDPTPTQPVDTTEILDHYKQHGVVVFDGLFDQTQIDSWNRRLDPLFLPLSDQSRSYVRALPLYRSGVLGEFLCPAVRNIIATLDPQAVVYHCHSNEIAAGIDQSHIDPLGFMGWHPDSDVTDGASATGAECFSIFVYLTRIESADDGAFEIVPVHRQVPLRHGLSSLVITGAPGRVIVWNRRRLHRANPNRSKQRRRIIKMSLQSVGTPNAYLDSEEPGTVLEAGAARDPFLSRLFGSTQPGSGRSGESCPIPGMTECPCNASVQLPPALRLKIVGRKVRNRLMGMLTV